MQVIIMVIVKLFSNLTQRICNAHLEQNMYLGYIMLQMLRVYFIWGM